MDRDYYEQTVAGRNSSGNSALYALSWAAIALLLVMALFFGANIVALDPNAFVIRWPNVILLAVCLVISAFIFMRKDYLRIEYDYILRDGDLEVCAVLNRRRRKKLGCIALDKVTSCGIAGSGFTKNQRSKEHKWFLNTGNKLYFITYREENEQHTALLELDEKLAALVRDNRHLATGVWKDAEGKSSNYAGIS